MILDYSGSFQCVVSVAQSMLGHAGKVEVFEDEDGWLCIRTRLMKTRDLVHEPVCDGTPNEDRRLRRQAARKRAKR